MRRSKILLIGFLTLLVAFSLAACTVGATCTHTEPNAEGKCDKCGEILKEEAPSCTHADENGDGVCDECNHRIELVDGTIPLITGSAPDFQVVVSRALSQSIVSEVDDLVDKINSRLDTKTLKRVHDSALTAKDYELLIGSPVSRGEEYKIDEHYLGYEGYCVKILGTKIIVLGGSDKALLNAIEHLEDNVFRLTKQNKHIDTITMTEQMCIENKQTDYAVQSVTIANADMDDYVFAVKTMYVAEAEAAKALQELFYRNLGKWLEIVSFSALEEGQKAIYIELIDSRDDRATPEGFHAYVDEDSNLRVECEFNNRIVESTISFLTDIILNTGKTKVAIPADYSKTLNVRYISYSEFGAVGNGITNDFNAIKETHDYANLYGHKVKGDENAKYRITATNKSYITVKTDTDWSMCEFIIDDASINYKDSDRSYSIFKISSDYEQKVYVPGNDDVGKILADINEGGGIDKESFTKLDLGLGYPALVFIYDETHHNYIRYQSHHSSSSVQKELVLIDEHGNVDSSTPLLFDYAKVTKIVVYRISDAPITLKGGTFTTIANTTPLMFDDTGSPVYYYYSRNISIARSNTVIDGLTHVITNEGNEGAPYSGFLDISNSNNVTIRNCIVQAHRNYSNMGSYDLSASDSNNVTWENCIQSNFFLEDGKTVSVGNGYWGVMGSNFSKNLTYDGCTLTRFDAHCGVYNATIRSSNVGDITLIGGGSFTIEDSYVYTRGGNNLLTLRKDYGSTWNGTMYFKNVTAVTSTTSSTYNLISGSWGNWDFGYATYMPNEVIVDGFTVLSTIEKSITNICLASGTITLSPDTAYNDTIINPYTKTERFVIRSNANGYTYSVPLTLSTNIVKEYEQDPEAT